MNNNFQTTIGGNISEKGITRIAIMIVITILLSLSASIGIWFWQENNLSNVKQNWEKEKTHLQSTIDDLKAEIEEIKAENAANTDKTKPTVKAAVEIKRYVFPWTFQFSEEMNAGTITISNLNLYSKSLSQGTYGTRTKSNDLLNHWTINYNEQTKILTLVASKADDLTCASCGWELEFTTNMKDKAENSLVKKIFAIQ